jgi:hypothetical protein
MTRLRVFTLVPAPALAGLAVLAAFAVIATLGCRAETALGSAPPAGAGGGSANVTSSLPPADAGGGSADVTSSVPSSTELSTQTVAMSDGDGGYTCAPGPIDPYTGCPPDPTGARDSQPCSQPIGTVCDYQSTNGFMSCSCMPTAAGNRWECFIGGGQDGCPLARPAHGSPCGPDDYGRICGYLRSLACTCDADRNEAGRRTIMCDCSKDLQEWACSNNGLAPSSAPDLRSGTLPPFDESPCFGDPI